MRKKNKDPNFPCPEQIRVQETCAHIQCELTKAGITLEEIGIKGNVITVTTNEEHLAIAATLCDWVKHKDFTIEFVTSGQR